MTRISRPTSVITWFFACLVLLSGCSLPPLNPDSTANVDTPILELITQTRQLYESGRYQGWFIVTSSDAGMESLSLQDFSPREHPVPSHQEVVSYGHVTIGELSELSIEVWVQEGPGMYYSATVDPQNSQIRSTDGEWFMTGDPTDYVTTQVDLMVTFLSSLA